MTKELGPGEKIVVDTESVVAWSETIELSVKAAGGCCACACGGEGMFNTVLTGPGVVYFQSMSFGRFRKALGVAVAQAAGTAAGAEAGGADMMGSMLSGAPDSQDMAR